MKAWIVVGGVDVGLDDSGRWMSKNARLADFLNSRFGPELYPPTPSAGTNPYANQARAAAESFGVTVAWDEDVEVSTPGTVY